MLALLREAISRRYGLAPRPASEPALLGAAQALAERLGIPPETLVDRALRDPELLRALASRLTVDETYFLRQAEHFDLILSRLTDRPATLLSRPATLWSAGCSRGEEPFSLAIVLAERAPWAVSCVRILATDLSAEAIRQARAARYSEWSMRVAPDWLRSGYFQPVDGGCWQLCDRIRGAVSFENLSIDEHLSRMPDQSVDVVLFRNVAIYLEPPALEQIYAGFARVLVEDGLLLIGASDPPPGQAFLSSGGGAYHPRPRRRPAPAAPARPSPASVQELYQRAVQLGDRGSVDDALDLATRVIGAAPSWSAGYVLRANLLLACARHREATADLRHAVYLSPQELLPRFLCAAALRAAKQVRQAAAEARELVARLRRLPGTALLEDGRTTAAELLAGALDLLEDDR
ncbi:MAG TPA: CheR family methyltransferase [Myxococcales bacterium]|jgi:chemotaxis protein methyltransferase CheR